MTLTLPYSDSNQIDRYWTKLQILIKIHVLFSVKWRGVSNQWAEQEETGENRPWHGGRAVERFGQ